MKIRTIRTNDEQKITDALNSLAITLGAHNWDPERCDAYLDDLSDLQPLAILDAIHHVRKTWEGARMPPPAAIRKAATERPWKGGRQNTEDLNRKLDAEKAWAERSPHQRMLDELAKWVAVTASVINFALPKHDPMCDQLCRFAAKYKLRLDPVDVARIATEILTDFRREYRRQVLDPDRGVVPAGNVSQALGGMRDPKGVMERKDLRRKPQCQIP